MSRDMLTFRTGAVLEVYEDEEPTFWLQPDFDEPRPSFKEPDAPMTTALAIIR